VSAWLFVGVQMLHAHSKHKANGILGDLQAFEIDCQTVTVQHGAVEKMCQESHPSLPR